MKTWLTLILEDGWCVWNFIRIPWKHHLFWDLIPWSPCKLGEYKLTVNSLKTYGASFDILELLFRLPHLWFLGKFYSCVFSVTFPVILTFKNQNKHYWWYKGQHKNISYTDPILYPIWYPSAIDWMIVSPQNSYVKILTPPKMTELGRGAFGRCLNYEVGSLFNGISALLQGFRGIPCSFHHVRTQ